MIPLENIVRLASHLLGEPDEQTLLRSMNPETGWYFDSTRLDITDIATLARWHAGEPVADSAMEAPAARRVRGTGLLDAAADVVLIDGLVVKNRLGGGVHYLRRLPDLQVTDPNSHAEVAEAIEQQWGVRP